MSQNNISIFQTRLNLDLLCDFHMLFVLFIAIIGGIQCFNQIYIGEGCFHLRFVITTLMYLDLTINYQCDTITHLGFYD